MHIKTGLASDGCFPCRPWNMKMMKLVHISQSTCQLYTDALPCQQPEWCGCSWDSKSTADSGLATAVHEELLLVRLLFVRILPDLLLGPLLFALAAGSL